MITTLAFIAGLFVAGQGLGAGEYGHEKDSMSDGAMMEESGQPKVAAHDLDSSQVSKMQKILKDKGFDAGPVDGIAGPRTKQALSSFQESEGLAVTGKPDKETLQALAPDAETQEFFGLSPEFDEKGMMEKQPQEEMGTPGQMETPEQERMRTPESSEDMKSY
jgi:peptidoglycan hydrolase-like protein with peptidoglycan-binding domain